MFTHSKPRSRYLLAGYGHIHPLTNTGKTACIVYAIIGIPFTLIFLSALVQRLLAPTFRLLSSFIRMCPNMDPLQVRTAKCILYLGVQKYFMCCIKIAGVLYKNISFIRS